jgi:hypothetical protein
MIGPFYGQNDGIWLYTIENHDGTKTNVPTWPGGALDCLLKSWLGKLRGDMKELIYSYVHGQILNKRTRCFHRQCADSASLPFVLMRQWSYRQTNEFHVTSTQVTNLADPGIA